MQLSVTKSTGPVAPVQNEISKRQTPETLLESPQTLTTTKRDHVNPHYGPSYLTRPIFDLTTNVTNASPLGLLSEIDHADKLHTHHSQAQFFILMERMTEHLHAQKAPWLETACASSSDSMQMYSPGHIDTLLNEINCNQSLPSPGARTKAIKVTYWSNLSETVPMQMRCKLKN